MTDPFPTQDLVRIIHEHGVQLLRSEGGWLVPSSERLQHVDSPDDLQATLGVQPIICDTQFNVPFFQPRRVIDPSGKPVSRARYLKGYVEDPKRRIYKYMVEHHLYCAVAHLGYLAEAYGGLAVLQNQNRWGLPEHARDHSQNQLQDSALRHGEAIFTSLCASLEASGMLVWREPHAKVESLPAALHKVMTSSDPEMRLLVAPLEEVWYEIGVRIAQYRDCTAAHHPITSLGGDSRAVLNEADFWEMRIEIPDNPEATKPDAFTFDQGIDLLDYCWRNTCTVVRCIEATLPPVYELAMLGREPSKWMWLTGE
jgi:hypothetical protein